MGTFYFANSVQLPLLYVSVFVDGWRRSDVFCTGVSMSHGTSGSTASFTMPGRNWDGGKWQFRGSFVQVFAEYLGGYSAQVFNGYITTPEGATDGQTFSFQAKSLIALGDNVYIGQHRAEQNGLLVEYPREVFYRGEVRETKWSVRSILRDIFSGNSATWRGGGGSIASSWRSMLKLGSLAVLSSSFNDITLGDIVYRQSTLRDALDQLLGLVGTVSFRERFDGNRTWLEFFELADPNAPIRTVRVARPNESITEGANVLTISHEESADDVKTRLIGLGDRRKYVVSVTTDHATAPLEKAWNAALESAVLANPEGAKRGTDANNAGDETRGEFSEEKAKVFRRFRLPECIRELIVEKENAIELSNGTKVPIQVWMFPKTLTYNSGTAAWTSAPAEVPKLLEGTQFDLKNGYFTLKSPAISLASSSVGESGPVDTWEAAVVGITLTVAGARLFRDTGVRRNGMSFEGIDGDGLTEVFTNESFGFRQITNEDFPFEDLEGDEHVYDDVWVFLDGAGWERYQAKEVMQDDVRVFREFVDAALREKNNIKSIYQVTTPYWTPAYRLGERVQVIGQNDFSFGTHQILSLSYDLTNDHNTTFSTDSSVPLVANNVLSSGGDK